MVLMSELDDSCDSQSEIIENNTIIPDQIREMSIVDGTDKQWAANPSNRRVLYGLDQEMAEFIDEFSSVVALKQYLHNAGYPLPEEVADAVYEFLNKRPNKFRIGKKKLKDIIGVRKVTKTALYTEGDEMSV